MRLSGTKTGAANQYRGLGDQLWDLGGARPTLDLNFAQSKDLTDATTGKDYVDFTRASSGTYVGSDGLIKTATTNLLTYSEDLTNTWSPSNATLSASAISAPLPNALNNPYLLLENDNTSLHYLGQVLTVEVGDTLAISFFAKAYSGGSTRYVYFYTNTATRFGYEGSPAVRFNINNGTISGFATNIYEESSIKIEAYPDGWYRCSFVTIPVTNAGNFTYRIGIAEDEDNPNTSDSYLGDGTSGIYIWGAQLEQSTTVGEYIPTTSTINSAPRFDHNPTTGESLGLLVEEARTNTILNNTMQGVVVGNPGTLPTNWSEGLVGLSREIVATGKDRGIDYVDIRFFGTLTGTQVVLRWAGLTASVLNGETWTSSIYLAVIAGELPSGNAATSVNLFNGGTYVGDTGATSVKSGISASLRRFIGTGTVSVTTTSGRPYFYMLGSVGENVDVTLRFGLPQFEKGAFATSVIPTSGAEVTRAADVAGIYDDNFGVFRTNLLKYSEEFDQAGWTKTGSSGSANAITAPNGLVTADKLVEDNSTGSHFARQDVSTTAAVRTASIYLKAGERSLLKIEHVGNIGNAGRRITVDLAAGSITAASTIGSGGLTFADQSIVPVGNGWYRFISTIEPSTTTGNTASLLVFLLDAGGNSSYTGDGTSGVYIWGAQLEEGSTATDYIKSDVNWTSRASNATYYDVNGTLKKSSYNLLTYSEEFDQGVWQKNNAVVTANALVAPDGTLTADLVAYSGASPSQVYYNSNSNPTISAPNQTVTGSIYIYSASSTSLTFRIFQWAGTNYDEVVAIPANQWVRITKTQLLDAGTGQVGIGVLSTGTAQSVYIWGAQLETGTTVGDYAKTTTTAASTARTAAYLPDGNGNFVSAGPLLLEPAGTNLLLRSEEFNDASWSGATGAVASAGTAIAPNGTATADTITDTNGTTGSPFLLQTVTLADSTTYTMSCYLKAGTKSTARVGIRDKAGAVIVSNFDLTAGTTSVGNAVSSSIQAVGNGWYRCSVVASSSTGAISQRGLIYLDTGSYTADGTGTILVWGAQLEANPYPTSYIPTTTSTATRAADVSTSAATTVFESDWYRQNEGTVFVDFIRTYSGNFPNFPNVYQFSDGTDNNEITAFGNQAAQVIQPSIRVSATAQLNFVSIATNVPGPNRYGHAFATDSSTFAGNATLTATDTSVSLPAVNILKLGERGGQRFTGCYRRLTYWPARLPNETLQTITQ